MYAMWWHKPLLAKEPIVIRGEWVEGLCAFMFMSSEISGAVEESHLKSETIIKTLFASLRLYAKTPEMDLIAYSKPGEESVPDCATSVENLVQDGKSGDDGFRMRTSDSSCIRAVQRQRTDQAGETAFFERRPKIQNATARERLCTKTTTRRWELSTAAIRRYPCILERQVVLSHDGSKCIHFKPEELVAHRVQNWPWDDLLRNVGGLMVGMILWLSNLCYGGVHASAWNDHFPSSIEKWLWRTSSMYIGFCGGLWIVLNWLTLKCKPLNDFWEKWMDGKKNWFSNIGLGILVVGCGGALCFARCFIVVEAFLSIRSLPRSAYDTPDWTQVLPHF